MIRQFFLGGSASSFGAGFHHAKLRERDGKTTLSFGDSVVQGMTILQLQDAGGVACLNDARLARCGEEKRKPLTIKRTALQQVYQLASSMG